MWKRIVYSHIGLVVYNREGPPTMRKQLFKFCRFQESLNKNHSSLGIFGKSNTFTCKEHVVLEIQYKYKKVLCQLQCDAVITPKRKHFRNLHSFLTFYSHCKADNDNCNEAFYVK